MHNYNNSLWLHVAKFRVSEEASVAETVVWPITFLVNLVYFHPFISGLKHINAWSQKENIGFIRGETARPTERIYGKYSEL